MSERLETLKKARERMIEDRDAHAKVLAAPFDRDKAERARNRFIEIQLLVDALDRAISGEESFRQKAEPQRQRGAKILEPTSRVKPIQSNAMPPLARPHKARRRQ